MFPVTWCRKCWPESAFPLPLARLCFMSTSTAFDELCSLSREAALIESMEAAIGWDERTYMPDAAGEYRAEQMTFLTGLAHQKRTTPKWGELLSELAGRDLAKDPHSDSGTTIRQLKRDYDKRCKLPQTLVEELTRASVLGQ